MEVSRFLILAAEELGAPAHWQARNWQQANCPVPVLRFPDTATSNRNQPKSSRRAASACLSSTCLG